MKKRFIFSRTIPALLCCAMLSATLAGCQTDSTESPASSNVDVEQSSTATPSEAETNLDWLDDVEVSRINYLDAAETLKASYQQNPDNVEVALAYAEKLLQLGNVDEAETVIEPIYNADSTNPQAILLSAKAAYLRGGL